MKSLVILILFVFCFASCKKEVSELPEPTQTGANTFGAKVNGELWVPQKFGIINGAPILEARYASSSSIYINARNLASSPTETEFEVHLENITGPGTYPLNQNTQIYPGQSASYGYYIKRRVNPLNEWITSSQYTGSVTLTKFDTVNHIVAGTFSFTAGSMDSTADPLVVTDGRFDVKIQ